jgi:hypothetical protein
MDEASPDRNDRCAGWAGEVVGFLHRHLPRAFDRPGFDHQFSSAYQMGCDALVALGEAEETPWGAVPLAAPRLPDVLPRWDDVCCAVLGLASQRGILTYCTEDSARPPRGKMDGWIISSADDAPLPPPNIAAAKNLGAARAAAEVVSVLRALGLVSEGRWTAAAELVLWREQPTSWKMDVASDPRFTDAVELALLTVPDDVRADIERLITITDADIDAAIARHNAHNEGVRAKLGPKARTSRVPTPELTRLGLERACCYALDWLFFGRWRLLDGWLKPEDAKRALAIFHDPLAIMVRRRVMGRLHPDAPFAAD